MGLELLKKVVDESSREPWGLSFDLAEVFRALGLDLEGGFGEERRELFDPSGIAWEL